MKSHYLNLHEYQTLTNASEESSIQRAWKKPRGKVSNCESFSSCSKPEFRAQRSRLSCNDLSELLSHHSFSLDESESIRIAQGNGDVPESRKRRNDWTIRFASKESLRTLAMTREASFPSLCQKSYITKTAY